jgi:hypothetical protein
MDIDEDESPAQHAPTRKRKHESDKENSKQSDDPDLPRNKRTFLKKTTVGGPVKLILRTSTPKSKGKKVTKGSSSTSDLSSASDSEDLQDPFFDDKDENEGHVRFPL